ncbi:ABC transporter ATP-binding protein [Nonomuraea sp. NPDC049695]|uniref:ABC transporter ATP-binding protein n=1 Tax=Nonomuraea sp. NPDC049695 TaxID=3154734 RepID=UPI00341E22FE
MNPTPSADTASAETAPTGNASPDTSPAEPTSAGGTPAGAGPTCDATADVTTTGGASAVAAEVRMKASPAALARALGLAWQAGRWHIVAYAVLALLEAAVPVTAAWLTKSALDVIAHPASGASALVAVGGALAVAGVAAIALPHVSRYVRQELERRTGRLAQDRLFAGVERFTGLARFEDPAFLDRMSLAHTSGGATPSAVVAGTLAIGRALVTVLGFLGALLVVNPLLAGAVLVAALPALAAELRLSRQRASMMWRIGPMERRQLFYRQLLTSVRAAKELRLFGAGRYFRFRMNAERAAADSERRHLDRRELGVEGGLGLLSGVIAGAGLIWALLAARDGRLTAGDIALLATSIVGVQSALAALVNEVTMAHQQLLNFDHYLTVTSAEPDLRRPARPVAPPALRRGIEFRDVWFRYSPGHPWSLRGVSFTIPYGSAVALVGRNGAGKSTIVKLLCRFYDPDRGTILWDGVDLRDLDPGELRARIGAVFQDYMEYDLTAAENIAIGDVAGRDRLTASAARIEAAARKAGVHDAVSALPRGYDTLLSRMFFGPDPEAGVVLSGGQWQRLALARAVLGDGRDLLILDEPSSGLDAEAEAEIHNRLREHRAGRTSLLISHRLGAVREADVLVVLDGGQVAERGSHEELMRLDGLYRRLFTLQAQGYQSR